jgi:hypothetical protein
MESGGDIMPENVRDLATCRYDGDAEVEKHSVIVDGSSNNLLIDSCGLRQQLRGLGSAGEIPGFKREGSHGIQPFRDLKLCLIAVGEHE